MTEVRIEEGASLPHHSFSRAGIDPAPSTNRPYDAYVYQIAPPAIGDCWNVLLSVPAYVGLFRIFVFRQVSLRYRQSILGIFWIVLQPLATTMIVLFMFQIIGANTSQNLPAGVFLFLGIMTWQFFSRGVQDGTMSLHVNSYILTKIYFPRIILPASGVLTAWFEFAVTFSLLLGICLVQGVPISSRIVLVPVFAVIISLAALAVSLWLAPINALKRDITFILPFLLQFGMYASPVLYSGNSVPERWKPIFYLNPMATPIEGLRWAILRDQSPPDLTYFTLNMIGIMALLIGGLIAFQKLESSVVDRI